MCNVMKRLGMSVGKKFAKFAKKAGNPRENVKESHQTEAMGLE